MTAHPSRRLARLLVVAATGAALVAPAAVARPIDTPKDLVSPDADLSLAVEPEQAPPRAPVVQNIDDGFDWGSAAIGAGGAGALFVLVSLGGVAIVSRHRIGVAR
jgi:hypothetical protein